MAAVNILKFGISSPADTTPLEELKRAGYDASQIIAVIGKTEGMYHPLHSCMPYIDESQATAASMTSRVP